MKRMITLFLILAMMLCLVACGDKGGDSTTAPTTEEPGSGISYTGLLDEEDAILTIQGNEAHFFNHFEEPLDAITVSSDVTRVGVVTSNTDGKLTVSFFEEGAYVLVSFLFQGANAELYRDVTIQMYQSGVTDEEDKETVEKMCNGEEVRIDFGSALWDVFTEGSDYGYEYAVFQLDDVAKTFTQLVEDEA